VELQKLDVLEMAVPVAPAGRHQLVAQVDAGPPQGVRQE